MNQSSEGAVGRGSDRRTALKVLGAAGIGAAAPSLLFARAAKAATTAPVPITVNWDNVALVSKTTPTLQVVVNPFIERSSAIHDNVFRALKDLHADYARFVTWFPYPRLSVPELAAPANGQTSWDFSLIDPMVEDFVKATPGDSRILNFSTTPEWMWQQPQTWTITDGQLDDEGAIGLAMNGASWTDYTFSVTATPLQTGTSGGHVYAQAGLASGSTPLAATATPSCCRTTPTRHPRRPATSCS